MPRRVQSIFKIILKRPTDRNKIVKRSFRNQYHAQSQYQRGSISEVRDFCKNKIVHKNMENRMETYFHISLMISTIFFPLRRTPPPSGFDVFSYFLFTYCSYGSNTYLGMNIALGAVHKWLWPMQPMTIKWCCLVDPTAGFMMSWQHSHVNKFPPMTPAWNSPNYHKTAKCSPPPCPHILRGAHSNQ